MEKKTKSKLKMVASGVTAAGLAALGVYLASSNPDYLAQFHTSMANNAKINKHFFFDKTVGKRKRYNELAGMGARFVRGLAKPKIVPYMGDDITMDQGFGFDWV
jgi:hypothetical protein